MTEVVKESNSHLVLRLGIPQMSSKLNEIYDRKVEQLKELEMLWLD